MSQARFQKQQREKARREKAAAKWARRVERREATPSSDVPVPPIDEAAVLAELADLHQRFETGAITFEDFSDAKDALIGRLDVR
jgi:hypothetical protein